MSFKCSRLLLLALGVLSLLLLCRTDAAAQFIETTGGDWVIHPSNVDCYFDEQRDFYISTYQDRLDHLQVEHADESEELDALERKMDLSSLQEIKLRKLQKEVAELETDMTVYSEGIAKWLALPGLKHAHRMVDSLKADKCYHLFGEGKILVPGEYKIMTRKAGKSIEWYERLEPINGKDVHGFGEDEVGQRQPEVQDILNCPPKFQLDRNSEMCIRLRGLPVDVEPVDATYVVDLSNWQEILVTMIESCEE